MAGISEEIAPSGFVEVEDGRLYYEVVGKGVPVVFVHGGLWDSRMWDDQFSEFAQRYRSIRYDVRGHGRSSRPSGAFSHVDDLYRLLAFLDATDVALVGLSRGGRIAIDFTLEYPNAVRALVAVAAAFSGAEVDDPDFERRDEEIEELVRAGELDRALELELVIWQRAPVDRRREEWLRSIARDNLTSLSVDWSLETALEPPAAARLSEISVPTLVIVGDRDESVMQWCADEVATRVPNATKQVVPGADHVPNVRYPQLFNEIVLNFLSRVDATLA